MTKTYDKFRIIFILIICFLIPSHLFAQSIHLEWTPSLSPRLLNYNIYRTTNLDSSFIQIGTVNNLDSLFIDENVQYESHYYYVVTALDILGNESGFSNVADTTVGIPVPVELINFSIQLNGNNAILEWTTEMESNNYGFEVQRSPDGVTFNKIGFITGENTNIIQKHYSFVDPDLSTGIYYYRLKQIDMDGRYEFSRTLRISVDLPKGFRLEQNYPNPFNSMTTIAFSLPMNGHVELNIYNVFGQRIFTLVDEFKEAGKYRLSWNGVDQSGKKVGSGVYYYKIKTFYFAMFRKMILLN